MTLVVLLLPVVIIILIIPKNNRNRYRGYTCYKVNQSYAPIYKIDQDLGTTGEYLIFACINGMEPGERILNNLYIPRSQEVGNMTEVDLVYINTSGIYVIESKNYSGWIF